MSDQVTQERVQARIAIMSEAARVPLDPDASARVARAVYGYPTLNKYAINPANPIRITVVSGHVILSGVVDSKADKDVAGIQANTVPGVFSVVNNLQVAGSEQERR